MGRIPYGFSSEDGRLVENPEQMRRIISMKRSHRRGRSLRTLARKHHLALSTTYKLVYTDLRTLKRSAKRNS